MIVSEVSPNNIELNCRQQYPNISPLLAIELKRWKSKIVLKYGDTVDFICRQTPNHFWQMYIETHAANNHGFYDNLEASGTGQIFAQFLDEESYMPSFVDLLTTILHANLGAKIDDVVLANLRDEYVPQKHSLLFEKLNKAVSEAWSVRGNNDALLAETNLVFYFGHLDPFFLVGALCSTEVMVPRRVSKIKKGLSRLGLSESQMQFLSVHAECDVGHGKMWFDDVVVPLASNLEYKRRLAEGIVARLETSKLYLDSRLNHFEKRFSYEFI